VGWGCRAQHPKSPFIASGARVSYNDRPGIEDRDSSRSNRVTFRSMPTVGCCNEHAQRRLPIFKSTPNKRISFHLPRHSSS